MIAADRLPHLLLYGPPGTGKTSTILACARSIPNSEVLELNASDDRGIDVVREQIKDFASTRKMFSTGYKLIVLDEADHLTGDAQSALRRIIEKYTKNVRFCLIGNYVNKIIPALQSRCTKFRFGPLDAQQVHNRLQQIALLEGLHVDESGIVALVELAVGDMRKSLNLMQACGLAIAPGQLINEDVVYATAGAPLPRVISEMVHFGSNLSLYDALTQIAALKLDRGLALVDIVRATVRHFVEVQYDNRVRAFVLEKLADLEYRLATGTSEQISLAAYVGVLQLARFATAHHLPALAVV
jgi:replication factor C subunit 3/5